MGSVAGRGNTFIFSIALSHWQIPKETFGEIFLIATDVTCGYYFLFVNLEVPFFDILKTFPG